MANGALSGAITGAVMAGGGAEAMLGVFPDEGFTAKANVGAGFVFRVKPAQ